MPISHPSLRPSGAPEPPRRSPGVPGPRLSPRPNRAAALLRGCAFGGLVLGAVACGGPQAAPVAPETVAVRVAAARLNRSVVTARETQEPFQRMETWLRYNPPSCDCPPWEVLMYGHWERVWLEAARDAAPNVSDVIAFDAFGSGAMLWVEAEMQTTVRENALGWPYPVLAIRRVRDEPDDR